MSKKIFFNDRYGLTEAVLSGRKTMTRRIVKESDITEKKTSDGAIHKIDKSIGSYHEYKDKDDKIWLAWSPFKVGDEVAVAQRYCDCGWNPDTLQQTFVKKPTVFSDLDPISTMVGWVDLPFKYHKGWSNKMFVLADLMPHRIRITDVKAERLQDISEEDAMREGIFKYDKPPLHHERDPFAPWSPYVKPYKHEYDNFVYRCSARWAFACLIDKISGKGTWERNPWVFAYTFELIK